MAKILVIDDDHVLCGTIKDWLSKENHLVELVHNGADAADCLHLSQYDIIVLDWGLPDMSGIDVLTKYRTGGGTSSVIMLTGRSQVTEKEQGLDSGADDYLTKPFNVRELSARIRSLLRRPDRKGHVIFTAGRIKLDPQTHTVTKDGTEVKLFRKEFALLEHLLRHPQEVFSAEDLLDAVWHSEPGISQETVRTSVRRIRQQLDSDGETSVIENVRGSGYKLGVEISN